MINGGGKTNHTQTVSKDIYESEDIKKTTRIRGWGPGAEQQHGKDREKLGPKENRWVPDAQTGGGA